MQPATVRRLLVFGVCLVGVGCLYLVPSMAGAPSKLGSVPTPQDLPTGATTASYVSMTTAGTPTASVMTSPGPSTPGPVSSDPTSVGSGGDNEGSGDGSRRKPPSPVEPRRTTHGATAADPGTDDTPPSPVGRLRVADADPQRLTITWPAATDERGTVNYTITVNGFVVATTPDTSATVAWFNDSNTHVIQVRAVDAAGNAGEPSPTLLVTRPTPPSTAPPSSASADPVPSTPPTTDTSSPFTQTDDGASRPDIAAPSPTENHRGTEEDDS